ncbi:HalOD1 output domain-containing protein [Natrialbaceae archaeon A-gly3]
MSDRITGGCEYEADENRREGGRREVRYDRGENEPTSVAVASALATYHGDDVTDTSTLLHEYIDPEALDALFADRYDGESRQMGRVHFTVEDATVVVTPDRVRVYTAE